MHRRVCAALSKRTWQYLHSNSYLACPAITFPGMSALSTDWASAELAGLNELATNAQANNQMNLIHVDGHDMNNSAEQ